MSRTLEYQGRALCAECGSEYVKKKSQQKYCCGRCRDRVKTKQMVELRAAQRLLNGETFKPVANTTIEALAPDVLICPVIYPSLLPYLICDDLFIMNEREYNGRLAKGDLDGLYLEIWRWGSRTSVVVRVFDGVPEIIEKVRL